MKIIHIMIASFYIEGMEYQENVLPRKHKELGLDVNIITSQYNFDKDYKLEQLREAGSYINLDGIEVTILKYKKVGPIFNLLNIQIIDGLYEKIVQISPDILFVHGCQFYDIKSIIKYKRNNPNVKLYVDNHVDYVNLKIDTWKRKLYYFFITGHYARSVARYTNKFWGVTPQRVDFLHDFYKVSSKSLDLLVMGGDENKIDFRNKDIIRSDFRKQFNIKETDFLVVTGGKIDRRKNIHLLLDVFKKLSQNVKLVVFGEPDSEMLSYFTPDLIAKNVILLGWIPSGKAYDLFLSADLGVFPGTHSVLWEQSIATGLPCIFKHWNGMEHVDLGGNCILVNQPEDEDMYVKVLLSYIIDLSLKNGKYNLMASIAIEKGPVYFSYKEIAKRSIEY